MLLISVYKQDTSGKDCLFKASSHPPQGFIGEHSGTQTAPTQPEMLKMVVKSTGIPSWLKTPHDVLLGSCLVNAENEI